MIDTYKKYGISARACDLSEQAMAVIGPQLQAVDNVKEYNQLKVLAAFQEEGLNSSAFAGSTGYGLEDPGRTSVERIFSRVFASEASLVRHQFSSGTHVLACCLKALLRPGDELLIASGEIYDSIKPTIGIGQGLDDRGSLRDFGISYRIVALTDEDQLNEEAILAAIGPATKIVYIQKSRGYELRPCLSNVAIGSFISKVKALDPDLIVMVDNCYGEFVETTEPGDWGADLFAGSLIKNPGGAIAPTGAYVCGRQDLVELVAQQQTAPGVGSHIGPVSGEMNRLLLQGLFNSPGVVAEALKSAIHAAALFDLAGFPVSPGPVSDRADIVQTIGFDRAEELIVFCQAIQLTAAVDSYYAPEPAPMPGYDCDIIMASGSFIQGSTIELSADGPLRKPYTAFLQGSLSFAQGRLAALKALDAVWRLRGE